MAAATADSTTSVELIISQREHNCLRFRLVGWDFAMYGLFTSSLAEHPIVFVTASFSFQRHTHRTSLPMYINFCLVKDPLGFWRVHDAQASNFSPVLKPFGFPDNFSTA